MPLLSEAIRRSNMQAARYALEDGATVVVERVTGPEGPFDQEQYAASIVRPDSRNEELFAAENLIETLSRLHELGIAGFAPEKDGWQPILASPEPGAEQPAAHTP